ncbi:MAG: sulfotransferase [Steroidobacteraceae bacterium]|jgi:tetratricopeptide (TPR) repeat protein
MKPGRNENCPCGSGQKYKRCCGREPAAPPSPAILRPQEIGALVTLVGQERLSEAEREARALLRVHPDAGMLWKILGIALMRQGRDPLAAMRRTVELLPRDAEAHGNLGLALHDHGQWSEALESLERALQLRSDDEQVLLAAANALNNLGNLRRDAGELREAVSLYRRAIELDPARAESHCNLGNALLEARRIDEAAASYIRAVAVDPRSALAHLSLATVLRVQGRGPEAESSCRAALALEPAYAEALCLLGELLADQGRFPEAEISFQGAIEADPDFPFAYCGIAAHRKMTAADTAWLEGVRSVLAKRPPLRHTINLHFALGKYFDDVGRYDEAFGHYRQAHEHAKRYGSKYDAGKLARRVDRLISIFDAPSLSARAVVRGSPSERTVFIIGMPRSGTSLAEQILASHPAVFGAGEIVFWDAAFGAHETAGFAGEAGALRLSGIAGEYLERVGRLSGGAARVIDKMPANFLYAGLIQAALPEARFIHMCRHPIDTCLSIYFQNFFNRAAYADDLDDLADYYSQYARITAYWRDVLPPTRLLEVPYEGLVADQEGWTRRMLDFIGLAWDPRCLDFHATERAVITASKWQVRQKIYSQSAGRWRNYEKHLGPLRRLLEIAQPDRPQSC